MTVLWNTILALLVAFVPRPWWRNERFSQFLADFSEPLVWLTDELWLKRQDGIAVEIRDRGQPMSSPPPESPVAAETDAESGRGWHIIRQWTDTATYTRERNENVLTLTRRL